MKKTEKISDFTKEVIQSLVKSETSITGKSKVYLDKEIGAALEKESSEPPSLIKSILNVLDGGDKDSITRLAFTGDPTHTNVYASLYKPKQRGLPETIQKRIAVQDDLVASIVQCRSNQVSQFGRPRADRFSNGFVIEPKQETIEVIEAELDQAEKQRKKKDLQQRIARATQRLLTCGNTKGWNEEEQLTFSQFLSQSTRSAVVVGRSATEIIHVVNSKTGDKEFHSFRVIDAGTIFKAVPQKEAGNSIRKEAKSLLETVKNKKLKPEKFMNDEYVWVQVIDNKPVQAFTSEECIVHNFYSVPDVEMDGYPITPLDTVIAAVTTHINITTHNKLYFQNGRASRGMLVIKSDDVDESVVTRLRQQFNASINSVNAAWRMPVFGVGTNDDITWAPIDNSGRDMEFQYLSDMNARVILSAFQVSPDELPGWSHLSRGTNSQALSESNQEFKLEAHRDLGIRPLIRHFEDFLNSRIFPLIDEQLALACTIKLVGLESDTAEKEAVRLQQDSQIHMTFDQLLQKVEKRPIGKLMGGEFPLNPQYQALLDKYYTVGEILEFFCGREGASKDPKLAYRRDAFWFQWLQMNQQQSQEQGGTPSPGGGEDKPESEPIASEEDKKKEEEARKQYGQEYKDKSRQVGNESDLARSLEMATDLLTKSETKLPASRKRLLQQQRKTIENFMKDWETDLKTANESIADITKNLVTKK